MLCGRAVGAAVATVLLLLVAFVSCQDDAPMLCNGTYETLSEHRWKSGTLGYDPQVLRACYAIPYDDSKDGDKILRVWTQTVPNDDPEARYVATKVFSAGSANYAYGNDQPLNSKNETEGWLNCMSAKQPGGTNEIYVMVGCNGLTSFDTCPGGAFSIDYRVRYDYLDSSDYSVESCLSDFDHYGGLSWWVWVLLVVSILFVCVLIILLAVFLVWRAKQSKPQYSVYDEDIDDYLGEDDKVTIEDDVVSSFPPPVLGNNDQPSQQAAATTDESQPILSVDNTSNAGAARGDEEYEDIS